MSTQIISKKLVKPQEVDFSSIIVAYKAKNGSWRAFAHPYDVTIEGETKKQVLDAIRDMVSTYEDGLKKYGYPDHLAFKHLSDSEDNAMFSQIALESIANRGKVSAGNYYAETRTVSS